MYTYPSTVVETPTGGQDGPLGAYQLRKQVSGNEHERISATEYI